jgi:sugar (pentulose or hexulose) kinase
MLPELQRPARNWAWSIARGRRRHRHPAGTPLFAAAADKACEVLGAGCVDPHVGCLSYGTTATINTTSPRYVEVTPFVPPYPAAVPGAYSTEVQVFRGYWMVNWFKEQFGHHEQLRALAERRRARAAVRRAGRIGAARLDGPDAAALLDARHPGAGARSEGRDRRLRRRPHARPRVPRHPRGTGLCAARRQGAHRTAQRRAHHRAAGVGRRLAERCGDAAHGRHFRLPTARPHVYETSGLGAAIDAAVGLGLYPDFASAVAAMTRVGRVFEPIAHNRAIYDRLYKQVYRKMYRQLQPLYREIAEITGYPKHY